MRHSKNRISLNGAIAGRIRPIFFLGGVALLGSAVLVLSTPWGVGLSPDSALYVSAARSLIDDSGFAVPTDAAGYAPVTHYPPLYSALLAGIGVGGGDLLEGARWLNATLFFANILLAGLVVFNATGAFWPTIFASLLIMSGFPMVQIHSMAWSEPVFILFALLSLLLLALWLAKGRPWMLFASAAAVGVSILTRYVGFSLFIAGLSGIALLSRRGRTKRLLDVAIFVVVGSLPIALWLLRNLFVAGSSTNRGLAFHPATLGHLTAALDTVSTWIAPGALSLGWRRVILFTALALFGSIWTLELKRAKGEKEGSLKGLEPISWLLTLFLGSYGLVLWASISFLDAQIPLNHRMLSPVYVALVLLAVAAAANGWIVAGSSKTFRAALFSLALTVFVSQSLDALAWLELTRRDGVGYASRGWTESDLVKRIAALDSSRIVFTNGPDVLYLLTGRPSYMIPRKITPDTRLENGNYPEEIQSMKRRLEDHDGWIVYFNRVRWRWYLPSEAELRHALTLRQVKHSEEGSIYELDE